MCDEEVKSIAGRLWGKIDGTTITEKKSGKGKVVFGKTIREVLLSKGIQPDFEIVPEDMKHFPAYPSLTSEETEPGIFTITEKMHYMAQDVEVKYDKKETFIDFIHRTTPDAEIYFVANRKNKSECVNAVFRVSGRQPELWNPLTGEKQMLPEFKEVSGRTHIPLKFNPYDSWLVVFPVKHSAEAKQVKVNFAETEKIADIGGIWNIQFDKEWLYPTSGLKESEKNGIFQFSELTGWTKHPVQAIRYFSGTAVYTNSFEATPGMLKNKELFLDLGDVSVSAKVILNGLDLGVVWRKPFRVDISKAVKPGKNELKIEVVNLWPNRLIGDENLPEQERKTFTNMRVYKADSPLLPSGLLGPVILQKITDK
jgi:hypothetical protein